MVKSLDDIIYSISNNPSVRFLRYKPYFLERDAYKIASIIFNAESALRLGHDFNILEIPICRETFIRIPVIEIEAVLTNLLNYVTYRNINVKVIDSGPTLNARDKKKAFKGCQRVCLFSGGVDSSTGLALSLKKYGTSISAVFACHSDQGKIRNVVKEIFEVLNQHYEHPFDIIHVPRMYSQGYSQLRGFLYVVCAGIFAKLRRAKTILVTECGSTMYQIRFSPFDSITMTTHPFVMSAAKKFIELLFKQSFEIIIPFENLTKAEISVLNPYPEMLPLTHSCIGSRWIVSGKQGYRSNCGTCYGCVIRRLGLITAGVKDTRYEKDPLYDPNSNLDNLQNLLAFSAEVIIDYHRIDDFTIENIEEFKKRGLFTRFALDNICALHYCLKSGYSLTSEILHHYHDVLSIKGNNTLDARIRDVRKGTFKANYKRVVK